MSFGIKLSKRGSNRRSREEENKFCEQIMFVVVGFGGDGGGGGLRDYVDDDNDDKANDGREGERRG